MTIVPPVKPDATPEEVRAVVEDDQGGQIFSQAVSSVVLTLCSCVLNTLSAYELEQVRGVSSRLP